MQNFATQAQRIGILKGEILAHADPKEVLGITGMQKRMPKNVGETVKLTTHDSPWRVSGTRKTVLSIVMGAAAAWPILLIGVAFPKVAVFALGFAVVKYYTNA